MILLPVFTSYNLILILAAVIPAIYLMVKVYKNDRVEPESTGLLFSLVMAGVFSSFLALVEEMVLERILGMFLNERQLLYQIILYYVVVAVSEESSKYIFMKRKTWNNPEFDCKFDGIVYAAFTSLGFALWENISYVFSYGLHVALIRALTAVPGHACFGIFMGVFYSIAKQYDYKHKKTASSFFRKLAVFVPVLLHGTYDFLTAIDTEYSGLEWIAFVVIPFLLSNHLINKMSKDDGYMTWHII